MIIAELKRLFGVKGPKFYQWSALVDGQIVASCSATDEKDAQGALTRWLTSPYFVGQNIYDDWAAQGKQVVCHDQ